MDLNKLEQLNELRLKGAITEAEFNAQKAKLMEKADKNGLPFDLSENSYCAVMNFIQLAPGIGWIAALVLWAAGKEHSEQVNRQGYYILNFMLSFLLYGFIGALLLVFPALIVAGVGFVLALIQGFNALNGKIRPYPLTISFIKC